MQVIWQAKLTGEEWEGVSDETLDRMCELLDGYWESVKDNLLQKGGDRDGNKDQS